MFPFCSTEIHRIAIALKRIGYLINQYPMASQTFIRREIAAIEAMGTPIKRYAVRGWDTPLVDSDDQNEAAKTRRILDVGIPRLLWALLATAVSRPRTFRPSTRRELAIWVASPIAEP